MAAWARIGGSYGGFRAHGAAPIAIGSISGLQALGRSPYYQQCSTSQCTDVWKLAPSEPQCARLEADNPLSTRWPDAYDAEVMAIDIRPFREPDRPAVRQLTIAAFEGVSIDHNIDLRLGSVAGRDWRWRKSRDVDRDIDLLGARLSVAQDDDSGSRRRLRHDAVRRRDSDRLDSQPGGGHRDTGTGGGPPVDRARSVAVPRGRHDDRQDRNPRTERRSAGTSIPRSGFVEVARQIHYAMPLWDRPADEPRPDSTSEAAQRPPCRAGSRCGTSPRALAVCVRSGMCRSRRGRARSSPFAGRTAPARARS